MGCEGNCPFEWDDMLLIDVNQKEKNNDFIGWLLDG